MTALSHKSDVGGVMLNIISAATLRDAWAALHATIGTILPELALEGVLVETMAARGTELIVGARRDPDWGPVLLIGFGGVLAEALKDVRLVPAGLSRAALAEELHHLRAAALLRGFRGSVPLDVDAVTLLISRLGALMLAHPEIAEIDINPVMVWSHGKGALALDALIVGSPGQERRPA